MRLLRFPRPFLPRTIALLFACVFSPILSFSSTPDTLKAFFETLPRDTASVRLLIERSNKASFTSNDLALLYAEEALAIALETKVKKAEAEARYALGVRYMNQSEYIQASDHLFKAQELFKETGAGKERILSTLNSLGNLYARQEVYSEAITYYKQALDMAREIGNRSREAVILGNLGTIHYRLHKQDTANLRISENYTREALAIHVSKKDTARIINCMNGLSLVLVDRGQFDAGLRMLDSSMKLMTALNDSASMVYAFSYYGRMYRDTKKFDLALDYFSRVLNTSRRINNRDMVMDAYISIAETYADMGRFGDAYDYHTRYARLKDSLVNTENTRTVTDLRNRIKAERDANVIESLQQAQRISELDDERKRSWIIGLCAGLLLLAACVFLFYNRARIKERSNRRLADQNAIIEEKNKSITDSITYAQRIQTALLSSGRSIGRRLPEHFLLYQPKDIVSGDFYWAHDAGDTLYFSIADCTGHGVPGAFMSLLSISFLNEAVAEKKIRRPDLVLGHVRTQLISSLNPEGAEELAKDNASSEMRMQDGMDGVFCALDVHTLRLQFACANNPLWLIRNGALQIFGPDKMPVGQHQEMKPFTLHELQLEKGDTLYLFTDGFADQFGGPQGKKFKYRQLQETLLQVHRLPAAEQQKKLAQIFESWKGALEQIDDVLVFGATI